MKELLLVGADPGLMGGFGFLRMLDDQIGIDAVVPMPTIEVGRGKKKQNQIDLYSMQSMLRAHHRSGAVAYVERVGARPNQGVTSMFTFGRGFGVLEASLAAVGYRIEYIEAGVWKRRYKLGSVKEESLLVAKRLFPSQAFLFEPVRGRLTKEGAIGLAEAVLIARCGLERELRLIGQVGGQQSHLAEVV